MIKAVIFDIGGVILNIDALANPLYEAFAPIDKEVFWQEVNEKFSALCRGEGTLYEFWKGFAKEKGVTLPENTLRSLWANLDEHIQINDEVKDLISKIKGKYKLALISNVIKEHADHLRKDKVFMEIYNMFDIVTYSYEVRMTKDSKEIFLHTLNKLDLKPQECIFIDDTKKFVDKANEIGIKGIKFKNPNQLKKELKNLGVII